MAPQRPHFPFDADDEPRAEAARVLVNNPEATDAEVCDAVNTWWTRKHGGKPPLTPEMIAEIRWETAVPQTTRKPFQKHLF